MKMYIKRAFALILTLALVVALLPNRFGVNKVEAASDTITYIAHQYVTTKNTDYGYIMEPDKPGTYPVVIVHHGQSSYTKVKDYMMKNITDWVNKGLLEPMIVITPCVQEATYIGNDTFVQQKTPGLLQKIKDGTFQNMLEYATIDTTKKPALCGYSLGGAMTAYAGMKYKDSFSYLGIISPGIQALYPGSQGNPQNWILMDEDTQNYQLTTDPDHLFMIFSGRGNSDIIYDDVANVHMTEYGRAAGFTHVTWKVGEHNSYGGFDWSLLYFLYTLQHGKQPSGEPSDEVLKKAFGNDKNFSRTVYHPGDSDNRETITGQINFGSNPAECGYYLYANIPESNADNTASGIDGRVSFSYRWYRDGQRIKYFYEEGSGNKRSNTLRHYMLTEEDIGHKITVEAYNSVGVRKGVLTLTTSGVVKKKSYVDAPKNLTTTPATGSQKNGSIGNVTTAMEYASKADNYNTWTACTGSSVTGLAAGEYRVRYKETGVALASQVAIVTIGSNGGSATPTPAPTAAPTKAPTAKPTSKPTAAPTAKPTAKPTAAPTAAPTNKPTAAPSATPAPTLTGKVDIVGEAVCGKTLCASINGCNANVNDLKYQWKRDGVAISNANNGNYVLQKEDIGTIISCDVTDKSGKHSGTITGKTSQKIAPAPTAKPTAAPTAKPTAKPTAAPTAKPTSKPTAAPTAKPTAKPTATTKPTAVPTAKPTKEPTSQPTKAPEEKTTEAPVESPTEVPEDKPIELPTVQPEVTPTEQPDVNPTNQPAVTPTNQPTETPTEASKPEDSTTVKEGALLHFEKTGNEYKITKVNYKDGKLIGGNVTYMRCTNKDVKKVIIPAYIKINGVRFNVTKINAKAFKGCSKLKKIIIKTKKLTKIGSKVFSGIHKKAKIIVPKSKYKKYKKMIKKAKTPKKVKITK